MSWAERGELAHVHSSWSGGGADDPGRDPGLRWPGESLSPLLGDGLGGHSQEPASPPCESKMGLGWRQGPGDPENKVQLLGGCELSGP